MITSRRIRFAGVWNARDGTGMHRWRWNLRERGRLEETGVDGKRIKMDLKGMGMSCPNYMVRFRDQLHSLANTVMNVLAPYKAGTLLTS
jgi:hypothetical protein